MNETPPSLDDLISRHFDEALPSAEHQRLTAALNEDFEARLDFVEAARLHAGLEALAPALPPARKWHPARWVLAGAAAALIIGGGFLFWQQPRVGAVRITLQDMDARPDGKPEKPKPSGFVRRVVKAPAAVSTMEPLDVPAFLRSYYVNVSPHGMTFRDAVAKLQDSIRAANVMERPELKNLNFVFMDFDPRVGPDPVIHTPLGGPMSAHTYLETCSVFRGITLLWGGDSSAPNDYRLKIHPYASTSRAFYFDGGSNTLVTQEIRVRPDFLSMAVEPVAPATPNRMAEHLKRNYGIDFETGESAAFAPDSAILTVHAKRWKLDLLEQHINHLSGQIVQNAFVTGKFIKLPRTALPAGFDEATGMIMDLGKFNGFLASLEDDTRSAIFASPSIIMRPSQSSRIEIRQETQDPGEWIGFSQSVTAMRSGELVKVEGEVDLGIPAGGNMPHGMDVLRLSGQTLRLAGQAISHFKTGYELWFPNRSTGLFVLDLPENQNEVVLVCLGATMVDPAGIPIRDGADPEKMPNAK